MKKLIIAILALWVINGYSQSVSNYYKDTINFFPSTHDSTWIKVRGHITGMTEAATDSSTRLASTAFVKRTTGSGGGGGGVPDTRSISTGYGLSGGGDFTVNRTHIVDSATLSNYYLRRKDSSVNGGYYPYASNPKGYLTSATLPNQKFGDGDVTATGERSFNINTNQFKIRNGSTDYYKIYKDGEDYWHNLIGSANDTYINIGGEENGLNIVFPGNLDDDSVRYHINSSSVSHYSGAGERFYDENYVTAFNPQGVISAGANSFLIYGPSSSRYIKLYQDSTKINLDSVNTPQNIVWKDNNNALHVAALPAGGGAYTDEQAQDATGAMVSSEFTYTDATPLLEINTIAQSKITNLTTDLDLKVPYFGATGSVDLGSNYIIADRFRSPSANVAHLTNNVGTDLLQVENATGFRPDFIFNISRNQAFEFPDASGTIPLTVNSVAPNSTGNITLTTSNLGATTVGNSFFTLTNPSAITFPRINADNSVDALGASAFRTAIGAGTGDALTTNPLSQFAATTSAQLAGVLTDETGTGSAVFSVSPTLSSPTLGVASSTRLIITGTAGAGYVELPAQSGLPNTGTPTNANRIFSNSAGDLHYIHEAGGGLDYTIANINSTQTLANKTLASPTINSGTLNGTTITDGTNIVIGTTTGTKIGTGTNQKIGFFNQTPIIQPSGNIITALGLSGLGLIASPTIAGADISSGTVADARLSSNIINKTITNTYTAGATQIFGASSTSAGLRFSGVTVNPSSLVTGDVWYRSDESKFRYYDGSTARAFVTEALAQTVTNKDLTSTTNTFPALTGDVTKPSGSNATTIADGVVTNAKLATGIDAAKITTGALPDAQLSSNIPLKNASNTFTGTTNTFVHLAASGSTPTIAAGTGAGTNPTVSIVGNDVRGTISITAGTSPALVGIIATITFNVAYASAPYVVIWAANESGGAAARLVYVDQANATTTTFVLKDGTTALTNAGVYKFNYMVIQ